MNTCCPTDRLGVVAKASPQGTILENGDYITGPADSKFGIVYVYDIFGLSAQVSIRENRVSSLIFSTISRLISFLEIIIFFPYHPFCFFLPLGFPNCRFDRFHRRVPSLYA